MKETPKKAREAWEHFSHNGTVGAYLLYCAVKRGEKEPGTE